MTPKPTGMTCRLWHLICFTPCDINPKFLQYA